MNSLIEKLQKYFSKLIFIYLESIDKEIYTRHDRDIKIVFLECCFFSNRPM